MKVKDLKRILENVSDDFNVVLSHDSEGNDFSPLADYTLSHYIAATTWYGDIDDEGEPNALVLWPVN